MLQAIFWFAIGYFWHKYTVGMRLKQFAADVMDETKE